MNPQDLAKQAFDDVKSALRLLPGQHSEDVDQAIVDLMCASGHLERLVARSTGRTADSGQTPARPESLTALDLLEQWCDLRMEDKLHGAGLSGSIYWTFKCKIQQVRERVQAQQAVAEPLKLSTPETAAKSSVAGD